MDYKYYIYDTETDKLIPPELGQCTADDNTVTFGGYLGYLQSLGRLEFRDISNDLTELKVQKTTEINLRCQSMIIGGFTSSALGTPHRYDSDVVDQLNFMQAYDIAKVTNAPVAYRVWCEDGSKQFLAHTAAQFETAYLDGSVVKAQALQRCAELKLRIDAATTKEELETIVW